MAAITEELLKKKLQNGLCPVYILFGEDGYLKKNYCDKISRRVAEYDDIFNYARFEGGCDLQEVYDAALQLPMMSDSKCVILSDYDFEHCSKTDFDKLCSLIAEIPDTTVFIMVFQSVDFDTKKSSKFKKLCDAAEKNGGVSVRLDHRKMPELIKMLTDGAAKRGCRMDGSVAKYLVENSGDDINMLKNEICKLCAYVGEGLIDKAAVDLVSVKTVEASVYNLSKFILESNIQGALSVLDELFFMRIEPMIILYTVSGTYVDMYRTYTASKNGADTAEIAEKFGYKGREFVLDRARQNLRKMDEVRLRLSLNALVDADNMLKSFAADGKIVLEQLIIKLIYIIAKGESVDKA